MRWLKNYISNMDYIKYIFMINIEKELIIKLSKIILKFT